MGHITRETAPFNSTPLWRAACDRDFRALSYAERKMVEEFGVEPHIARLLAMQAYGSGGQRR